MKKIKASLDNTVIRDITTFREMLHKAMTEEEGFTEAQADKIVNHAGYLGLRYAQGFYNSVTGSDVPIKMGSAEKPI